jgi:UDP:flavonoid glycosyltransferase YjiC (YdhE family)
MVDRRFDFSVLMPDAAVFINHGGQNSIMTGLLNGVPQIVCPGKVFERKYNAASLVNLKAGIQMEPGEFISGRIREAVHNLINNPEYRQNAGRAGENLVSLGGAARAVKALEEMLSRGKTGKINIDAAEA